MKKTLITAVILAASCASSIAFAADTDTGTLTIKGEIKGTTCHFESGAQSAQINMHQIGLSSLSDFDAGKVYEGYQNKTITPFTITCPGSDTVPKLKFINNEFEGTGTDSLAKASADSTAEGVGYALLLNDQRIDINGGTPVASEVTENRMYTFDIAAQYARALSGGPLKAGTVNSVVTFTVVAD